MGRITGTSDLVETTEDDDVFYAVRTNRKTYTRFVKDRSAVSSRYVAADLRLAEDGSYTLFSAWVGPKTPAFPGDAEAKRESWDFWRTHALVAGAQEYDPATVVYDWPWGEPPAQQ